MVDHDQTTSIPTSARPEIVAYLASNPGGILEHVARDFEVSTFDVVRALPASDCALLQGKGFEAVMNDVSTWGDVLLIVHTDNLVLECKGAIPAGSFGRGHCNIHGNSPIGGHIRADRCSDIAFVARPFMGRASCSIQFFDHDGEAMFKLFVRRDSERNLIPAQVSRFENLRGQLCN